MSYKIKSLEIYPYGIKAIFAVKATGEVQLEIPATFDINTVKPIISEGLELAYFQARIVNRPHYVPEELRELYDKVHEKYRQMNLLQAKIAILEEQNKLFTMMPEKIGADAAVYIRDVQKIRLENKEEVFRLNADYDTIRKEYEILNNDYALKIPQNVTQVIEVRTGIRTGELLVEAFCNNASWTPSYRLNLDSDTGAIGATFLADVRQHSGLSFMGEIKLFTQNPSKAVQIPRLYTWALDFMPDPVLVAGLAERPSASAKMMKRAVMNQIAYDAEESMDFMEMSAAAPEPVMTESLINMAITATAKVEGNNVPVSMDLKKFKIPAKHKVMLCRDYGQEGWLVCTVDDMPEPILPGKVELYVDGQPAGTTQIGYIGRNEKAEISFGQMPLVKVKKDTLTAVSGTQSRFLSSSGSIEDGYNLEVTNGSSIEANIELLDKVPYPVNEKITVDTTIEPAAEENKENVLKWKFSLKPGEKQLISVKYKIKYPADKKLQY